MRRVPAQGSRPEPRSSKMMASLLHTRAGQHVARSWLPRNGAHRLLLPSLLRQQGGARSMTTNVVAPEAVGAVDGPPAPLGQAPVFTAFTVYKNKGALSVKPIKPTWEPTPGGGFRLDRPGTIVFEVAAAVAERRYDWENKVMIALRPEEAATLLAAPDKDHAFYHDTFKGGDREGSLIKTLKWSKAADGQAFFINASLSDKGSNTQRSASVSITTAEFYMLKCLIDASFFHLLGWDLAFQP